MSRESFPISLGERLSAHTGEVKHAVSKKPHRTLDDHQLLAIWEVGAALERGIDRLGIHHACGTGKSLVAGEIIAQARPLYDPASPPKDVLLSIDRANLGRLYDELQALGLDVGRFGDGHHELDRPVIVATIQSLQKNQRDLVAKLGPLGILIGDEADCHLTPVRTRIVQELSPELRVGFTATRTWSDGRDMTDLWGEVVSHLPIVEAVEQGILVPPLWRLYQSSLDGDSLPIAQGDYRQKELAAALRSAETHLAIAETYELLVPKAEQQYTLALVYLPSTELVELTAETLRNRYPHLTVNAWTGESVSSKKRQSSETAARNGQVNILVLCEMGGRALDLPNASILIDAYPTLSATKLEQRHSRVLRKLRGREIEKPLATIAQIVPRSYKRRPLCLPDLFTEAAWHNAQAGNPLHVPQGDVGAPLLERVASLRAHLEHYAQASVHVTLLEQFDAYRELENSGRLNKTWDERYEELVAFRVAYPDRWPSTRSEDRKEKILGTWVANQKSALHVSMLAEAQKQKLVEIGVQATKKEEYIRKTWDERYEELVAFRTACPDRWPLTDSEDRTDKSLGTWLANQKVALRDDKLAESQRQKLTELGVQAAEKTQTWDEHYEELVAFRTACPDRWPSINSEDRTEKILGTWLANQKVALRDEKLMAAERQKLVRLGVQAAKKEEYARKTWDERYEELVIFRVAHPNRWPSATSKDLIERSLGIWFLKQKVALRDDTLTEVERQKLAQLDVPTAQEDVRKTWDERYEELVAFRVVCPDRWPSTNSEDQTEKSLGLWLKNQKVALRDGTLAEDDQGKLMRLGVQVATKRP